MQRIEEFLDTPKEEIGIIGGGKKRVGKGITVALVQSLYKCADEVSVNIGHLIVDECHRTPSRTFTEAVGEFDSRYMLGLSATPFRRDRLSKLIFWYLGDVHHRIEKKELEEGGHILKAQVVVRETSFQPYYDPVNEYSKMLSELTQDDGRNRMIAADVAGELETAQGVCLVLSDRKKHCEILRTLLQFKFQVPARLLTGDLSTEERKKVLADLDEGGVRVLVATGQLIGEGFDCPNLATLFLATPIRFGGRVVQYLGRVLRPAEGKRYARVYDYVDVHVGPLVAAAKARQKIYGS
jgi:superfamily II DNA or RNA helicase